MFLLRMVSDEFLYDVNHLPEAVPDRWAIDFILGYIMPDLRNNYPVS